MTLHSEGAAAGHRSGEEVTRLASDFDVLKKTEVVADVAPVEGTATHAIVGESRVDVLFIIQDQWDYSGDTPKWNGTLADRRHIRVKVWSVKKPALFSYTDIKVSGKSASEMAKACEYAAAALAERQCALYGDAHEIVRCARAGFTHYKELVEYLTRVG